MSPFSQSRPDELPAAQCARSGFYQNGRRPFCGLAHRGRQKWGLLARPHCETRETPRTPPLQRHMTLFASLAEGRHNAGLVRAWVQVLPTQPTEFRHAHPRIVEHAQEQTIACILLTQKHAQYLLS